MPARAQATILHPWICFSEFAHKADSFKSSGPLTYRASCYPSSSQDATDPYRWQQRAPNGVDCVRGATVSKVPWKAT